MSHVDQRTISLTITRPLGSYNGYIIRNILLWINNNGTITPGNYYSNVPNSFIISVGSSTVYNGTLTSYGTLINSGISSLFTPVYFNNGNSVPPSDWFIRINSCSVSFEGCKRKININYEVYIKTDTGDFRQIFPSSFEGLSVH